jgi:hypothetical protein
VEFFAPLRETHGSCGPKVQPCFQKLIRPVAMAVSILQPVSTSEYSLPSRNRDDYQAEKMTSSNILVSSPYSSSEHHLDLSSVSETSQQLALALEILHPVTEEYPSQPYSTSFNWQEIVDRLPNDFIGIPSSSLTSDKKANSIA